MPPLTAPERDSLATMVRSLAIAIGAGLASALLFAASAQGAGLAILLAYVTPLPVMIAALGFGQGNGLVAAAVSSVCTAALTGLLPGVFFGLLLAFPSWWLSYLVLLARPVAPSPAVPGTRQPALLVWYPVGRVVAWGAGMIAIVILVLGGILLLRYGGFDATVTLLASRLGDVLGTTASDDLGGATSARHVVQVLPLLMAASAFLMLMVNLWLAGRIVQRSGLLSRPWPDLPDNLRLPKPAVGVLAVAAVLLLLPGAPRLASGVVIAAAGMAFALQGLGTAHALTRGLAARRMILAAIYFFTLSVLPSLVALAVLGIVDCLFPMRHRQQPAAPPASKP